VRTMGNATTALRNDTIDKWKERKVMNKKNVSRWDISYEEPVILPTETYGECGRQSCHKVGELGNGVCQGCWDKGASRVGKKHLELPTIDLSSWPEIGG